MKLFDRSATAMAPALLVGIVVGVIVVFLYIAGGIVAAEWSMRNFLAHFTLETTWTFLLWSGLTVAVFTIPITAYLRYGVVTPLAILTIVLLGWIGYGGAIGALTVNAVFGLGLYVIGLAPIYLVGYAVAGGTEYYARHRNNS